MAGDKSIHQLAVEFNVAKSSVSKWANEYREECLIPPFFNVTSFSSVEMMDELTMKYINWYNYVRPHSYNDYLTPMEALYR